MPKWLDRAGELLLDVFALAVTAQVGQVLIGRAVNSPTAVSLSPLPIVGPALDSWRAFWNQTYDLSAED